MALHLPPPHRGGPVPSAFGLLTPVFLGAWVCDVPVGNWSHMKRVYLSVGLQPQLMLLDSLGASGELAGLIAFQN